MNEHTSFPLAYFDPFASLHFSHIHIYSDPDGIIYVDGDRDPRFPVSEEILAAEKQSGSTNWLIWTIDASNPLLDRDLADFWQPANPLPYCIKNAVEEIAYQHRRVISASEKWAQCIQQAQTQNVHPFCLPLLLGEWQKGQGA